MSLSTQICLIKLKTRIVVLYTQKSNVRFQKYDKIFHKASVLMTRLNFPWLDKIHHNDRIRFFLDLIKVMTVIIIHQ